MKYRIKSKDYCEKETICYLSLVCNDSDGCIDLVSNVDGERQLYEAQIRMRDGEISLIRGGRLRHGEVL